MDVASWNVLHDGRLIAAERELPGELRLSIAIAYLCRNLPTQSKHLLLLLSDCDQFEYRPYGDRPLVIEKSAITLSRLELLSAESVTSR